MNEFDRPSRKISLLL